MRKLKFVLARPGRSHAYTRRVYEEDVQLKKIKNTYPKSKKKVVWVTLCYNVAHLLPLFFNTLRRLNPQPHLYLFAENNSTDDTLKKITEFEFPKEIIRLWFRKDTGKMYSNPFVPIGHIRQMVLTRLRQLDPDYVIWCDADIFVKTRDVVDVITTWEVDCIAVRMLRIYPEGLLLSAKWKHPYKKNLYWMMNSTRLAFDDTPLMVGFGIACLSRKVIQDRRINFVPIPLNPFTKEDLTSEDFGYCVQMKEHGYKCCLDGIVVADHVIYDPQQRMKPWTKTADQERPFPFEYTG